MTPVSRLSAALLLVAGLIAGCQLPFNRDNGAFEPQSTADDTPVNGWRPELKIGATYPGPIPRPVLEQRMRGVVRIENRENFLRDAGQALGRAATPLMQPDYPTRVGELAWLAAGHTLHPAPYRIVGTGFFVRDGGYIATNDHVIDMPGELVVKTWDGRLYPAKRLGRDRRSDLAILKIDSRAVYPTLPLGDNLALERGDYLLALGHPFGFDLTLSQGIVSGLGRPAGVTASDWMIQTDADINPGNSGGPLLNAAGEVVGINDAAYLWGSKAGFAQPVDLLSAHLETMLLGYSPERFQPFCEVQPIDDHLRAAENLPIWTGLRVTASITTPQREATRARLAALSIQPPEPWPLPGDLILAVDGLPIHTVYDYAHALALKEPYQTITLRVLRKVAVGEAEPPTAQPPDPHPGYRDLNFQLQLDPAD